MSKHISLHPFAKAIFAQRLPALATLLLPGLAVASPTGGTVIAGQVGITTPSVGNTVINQGSQSAIINWQQFSIGGNEYVTFNQPNASAAVLNRVVGGTPSEILGNLSANGRVFLINPQGVIFGKGAQVDVGSLVATTMNIADQDFLAGRYVFANGTQAPVTNAGTISAADGGFVVLAGDYVNNTGVIQAKLGEVALASGSAMTLDMTGEGLINLNVSQSALSNRAGVENLGSIAAQGGTVVMTAKVARSLAATAVNNSGVIQAQGISEHGGDIFLTADGGDAVNAGTLDVSGVNGNDAGSIRINSDHDITLANGSGLFATGAGGGDVRVVADRHLSVEHGAYATVARQSRTGKGGFAEYSGHKSVTIRDIVHLGENGSYLIDPSDVTIGYGGNDGASIDQATLESQLQNMFSGSVFTIDASSGTGTAVGNITVLNDLNGNTLNGHSGQSGYGGGLSLIAGPNGSIRFNDPLTQFIIDGDITLAGGTAGGTVDIGSLSSYQGAIAITGHGDITTQDLHAATGLIMTSDTGNIRFNDIAITNSFNDSAVAFDDIDANIDAKTGSITGHSVYLNNTSSALASGMAATLELTAGTSIDITGVDSNIGNSIGVYGGGGRGTGNSIDTVASATLTAGSTVTVASNITINGSDYHYTDPDNGEEIHAGGAELHVDGSQFTAHGAIDISGEGTATLEVNGHNGITVDGRTGVTAAAGSIIEPDPLTNNTLNLQYGYATATLNADDGNSNAIPVNSAVKTGNISVQGPNAIVAITGGTVEIGAAANTASDFGLSADASTIQGQTTVSDINSNTLYQTNAGSALISVLTGGNNASNQGIVTHGGIVADGPSAQINLFGTHDIDVGGAIQSSGRGYTQTGDATLDPLAGSNTRPTSLVSFSNDVPFALQNGTLQWGGSRVFIGSASANGPSGSAGAVAIHGNLSVSGVGNAQAQIDASSLAVTGDVSVGATQGQLSGTFTSQESIGGFDYIVTREIGSNDGDGIYGTATYGKANFDLNLSSGTADSSIGGQLDVRGNSASASINGGRNVTIGGDVLVGGFRNADPQFDTPPPVYVEQVSYAGQPSGDSTPPAIETHIDKVTGDINVFSAGFDQALTGTFSTGTHSISVEGTGVAGISINAAGITTGQIGVTEHAGSLSTQPQSANTATVTRFDEAVLQLSTTSGSAHTGQIDVNGTNLHVGGNIDAGANQVALLATGSIDNQIPGELIGFDHPLDGGQFPFTAEASRDLGALGIKTTDSIFFEFGADSTMNGLSLSAGKSLDVEGDYNSSGSAHGLQAGANPLLQGGTVAAGIHNVNIGATGTASIKATGNNAVGTNVDIKNTTIELASNAATGSTLAVNITADKAITVDSSTINANSIALTSAGDLINVQGGSNLIGNSVQIIGNGAGKNVSISNSLISTNGGVGTGNGDLKISSAGSFTVDSSTISDQSGGLGSITSTGAGANSTINNSDVIFTGPLQVTVTGANSSLGITGGQIGPSTVTGTGNAGALIGHALLATTPATVTPGNVTLSSSGDLNLDSTVNANQLTISAGKALHLNGTISAADKAMLSGVTGVNAVTSLVLGAKSLGVQSTQGAIDLTNSSLTIGNGLTTLGVDAAMVNNLGQFKPTSTAPNAAFISAGQVDIGNLTIAGDYLYVRGTQGVFNGDLVHTGGPLFYNFVPANLTAGLSTVGIENFVSSYAATNGPDAVLTLAFGSSNYSGQVVTSNDVGTSPTNFVFVTSSNQIQGYDTLVTGGKVATLKNGVLSIRGETPPPPPPDVQQQGADASYAVTQMQQPGESNGDIGGAIDAAGSGGDDVENHSSSTVEEKSCS